MRWEMESADSNYQRRLPGRFPGRRTADGPPGPVEGDMHFRKTPPSVRAQWHEQCLRAVDGDSVTHFLSRLASQYCRRSSTCSPTPPPWQHFGGRSSSPLLLPALRVSVSCCSVPRSVCYGRPTRSPRGGIVRRAPQMAKRSKREPSWFRCTLAVRYRPGDRCSTLGCGVDGGHSGW